MYICDYFEYINDMNRNNQRKLLTTVRIIENDR
jgi:hypothetical protein